MTYYLPQRLQQFVARWPNVEVSVLPARRDMLNKLVSRECDFAIGAAGTLIPTVRFHEILRPPTSSSSRPRAPAGEAGPQQGEDWKTWHGIAYRLSAGQRHPPMVDAAFQKRSLTMAISLPTGGAEMIKRYVEVGLGPASSPASPARRG